MVFKIDNRLMQDKRLAECSKHSAILPTFIKLHVPVVIKTFALSIFVWPFYTGFTVSKICLTVNFQCKHFISIMFI